MGSEMCIRDRFRVKGTHYSRTLTEVNRDEGLLRGFAKNLSLIHI